VVAAPYVAVGATVGDMQLPAAVSTAKQSSRQRLATADHAAHYHPLAVGNKRLALRLIQPDRVQSDDVVYTKIFSRIVTLNVIVPYVVDVFPGYRQEWRILFQM
jgi:hypothetical protein